MALDTEVFFNKDDLGKNLYRKTTYYKLMVTQEVLAKDKDEADKLLGDCGIDHSQVNSSLAETKNGVETLFVDADYQDSSDTDYIGKVVYEDDEYAKEDGLVEINTYADEKEVTV